MARAFDPTPKAVPPLGTRFHRIVTAIPAPGSAETLRTLQRCEPASMTGQPPIVGAVHGQGRVAGLHLAHPGGKGPDGDLAFDVAEKALHQKGLLLFAPVGFGGVTVKVAPPLTITTNGVREGLTAREEAIAAAMAAPGRA
jgi:4-aminobutyrate aminotransferase-like enzyme